MRTLVDPARSEGREKVHALQDAIKASQKSAGKVRSAELGPGEPEESSRCAAGARLDLAGLQACVRHQGAGRSDPASDRHRCGLGRQSRQGREPISASRPRRTTAPPSTSSTSKMCRSTASGRSASTTREGYFEKNPYNAYSVNNVTAKKESRRLGRHPVRRLRRQDSELPPDHEGLELHGAALSAARRNPERHMEIPGAAAGELMK